MPAVHPDLGQLTREERRQYVRENPSRRHRLRVVSCGHCCGLMVLDHQGHKGPQPGKREFRVPRIGGRFGGVRICTRCWPKLRHPRIQVNEAAPAPKPGKAGTVMRGMM